MKRVLSSKWFLLLKGMVYFIIIATAMIWFVHFEQGILHLMYLLFALVFSGFCVYIILNKRKHRYLFGFLIFLALLTAAAVGIFLLSYSRIGAYPVKAIETGFFQDKHVMVIVPHQDDDINLVGGIAEQYTHRGSRVSMVYTTNGDAFDLSETRFREALEVAGLMGIPEEDVHFLGFGDGWQPVELGGQTYEHIYSSPDENLQWISDIGRRETYGTSAKDCVSPRAYTRQNYADTIRSLILELRPDVIYVVDYDTHIEHRGTTLFFDEAMCSILRSVEDYQPKVYKGFCYRTAWLAPMDFLEDVNLLSTVKPEKLDRLDVQMDQYPWENRVRVPVLPSGLNRFLSQTDGFQQLSAYWSQGAKEYARCVINGDKVFWERRTDSLLYNARIFQGDVPTSLLNDFKLMDSDDLRSTSIAAGILPIHREIRVELSQPGKLGVLGLYEDPDADNQILEGYILLESGERITFGALNNNGTATYIPIPEDAGELSSFEIHVTKSTGTPGLTEIGGFSSEIPSADRELQYFMFTDDADHFVYDYIMDSDTQTFSLYTYPQNAAVNDGDFQIKMTGSSACSYTFAGGQLEVYCPGRASCQFEIRCGDSTTYLSLSNPGICRRLLIDTVRKWDYEAIYGVKPFSLEHQSEFYRELYAKLLIRFERFL